MQKFLIKVTTWIALGLAELTSVAYAESHDLLARGDEIVKATIWQMILAVITSKLVIFTLILLGIVLIANKLRKY